MSELPNWLQQTINLILFLLPYVLFALVCLFAINWNRMAPALAEGAWIPLVLLLVLIAMVWAQIRPASLDVFGILKIGNFWWQLGAVGLLAGLALFCGWVQQRYSWTPIEVAVEPPAHGHGHDHAHAHGHGHLEHFELEHSSDDPHHPHAVHSS